MVQVAADFRGITEISTAVLHQLRLQLTQRETHLAQAVLYAWPSRLQEARSSTLQHAIERVATHPARAHPNDLRHSLVQISTALWDYLTFLEHSVTDLFEQLKALSITEWNDPLKALIEAFCTTLDGHLEAFEQNIARLESVMQAGAWKSEVGGLFSWLKPKLLDESLVRSARASLKFLKEQFDLFEYNYQTYSAFNVRALESIEKLSSYSVLRSQGSNFHEKYLTLNRLLRIWEMDRHLNSLLTDELVKGVAQTLSVDYGIKMLRAYYQSLREILLNTSREIKQKYAYDPFQLPIYQSELSTLAYTVSRYRDFLLRTDPNPYVRSRWGFPEWLVGPEPEFSKQLQELEFSLVDLDSLYTKLRKSLDNPKPSLDLLNSHLYQDALTRLHAMARPGNSLPLMLLYGERLSETLAQFDELGSRDKNMVVLMGDLLNQALKVDWKFGSLHEIPGFLRLYSIHEAIVGPSSDSQHVATIKKLKHQIEQMCFWIKHGTADKHLHSIDAFVNDCRNNLELFFRSINPENKHVKQEQLLEYRFIISGLLHAITRSEEKNQLLRQRFLPLEELLS